MSNSLQFERQGYMFYVDNHPHFDRSSNMKSNMNKNRKYRSLLLCTFLFALSGIALANSQPDIWAQTDKAELKQPGIDTTGLPVNYETFRLNKAALRELLEQAPEEYSGSKVVILNLPMPDGSFSRFRIEHSLVVERSLLKNYPELGATYRGQGIDDPAATARFDFLPSGFHSMILSPNGTVIVNPYSIGDTNNYISFFKANSFAFCASMVFLSAIFFALIASFRNSSIFKKLVFIFMAI